MLDVASFLRDFKAKNILNRIFMPYNSLKIKYPVLEKKSYLTPIFWVVRWKDMFLKGKFKRSVNEYVMNNQNSDEKRNAPHWGAFLFVFRGGSLFLCGLLLLFQPFPLWEQLFLLRFCGGLFSLLLQFHLLLRELLRHQRLWQFCGQDVW